MKRCVAALAMMLTLVAGNAFAMYRTNLLPVTATVVPAVQFSSIQAMAFGSVVSGQVKDASADIVLNATNGLSCYVQLDGGLFHSAQGRFMRDVTTQLQNLAYSLYSDTNHTIPWGDDGITVTGLGAQYTGIGQDSPITVFGRLRTDLSTPDGDYFDTVTITVNY